MHMTYPCQQMLYGLLKTILFALILGLLEEYQIFYMDMACLICFQIKMPFFDHSLYVSINCSQPFHGSPFSDTTLLEDPSQLQLIWKPLLSQSSLKISIIKICFGIMQKLNI